MTAETYRGWTIDGPEWADLDWTAMSDDPKQPSFCGPTKSDVMLQIDEYLLEVDEAEDIGRDEP